jgi:anthranilate synthase/phosphoribosyltransferase
MIVIIDNYDSFTYNISQALSRLSEDEVRVIRNDRISLDGLIALDPSHLVISPGPGRPEEAGISEKAITCFAGRIPILGICLGMQAIAHTFGGVVTGARYIKHGVAEDIELDGKGLFRSVGTSSQFTRYHSLVVQEQTLPKEFEVTARAADGDIMGIRHSRFILEGIQFHPESIASTSGDSVLKSFLLYRREPFGFKQVLTDIMAGKDMSRQTAELFMEDLTDGVLDERQTSAILTALSAKGPAASEIAGCAAVLGKKKTPVEVSGELTDIVGTGGDGKGSFNISSMASLAAAACGVRIAKHGNRAVSSICGSADFFEALGLQIELPAERTAQIIEQTGFGFLYAPVYHKAMRFAAPVRRLLGVKTIMNLVGPLSNPAGATRQVLGVYEKSLLIPVAEAAVMLGAKRVLVVCSRDGYDEFSPNAVNDVTEIGPDGKLVSYTLDPRTLGISFGNPDSLDGGSAEVNAQLALDLLEGRGNRSLLDAVALNAGAALYVSGAAESIEKGYEKTLQALRVGSVTSKIAEIREATNA